MTLEARLDRLLGYLNRGVLDVPDGLIGKNTSYALNGTPYETLLGRSTDDPLVRLIARGPAGYRFAVQPLIRALEGLQVTLDDLTISGVTARAGLTVSGLLRDVHSAFEDRFTLDLTLAPGGAVARADVTVAPASLDRLTTARAS
ncbi:MAG: hypothetical protein FJW23_07395 [Acidimicrobiia bacterium]|nr:hypothetical protein [Acidimicrobiia bacterium]